MNFIFVLSFVGFGVSALVFLISICYMITDINDFNEYKSIKAFKKLIVQLLLRIFTIILSVFLMFRVLSLWEMYYKY